MGFTGVTLQPGYGLGTMAITWNVLPQYEEGEVFIHRSLTGTAPWELLNDEEHGVNAKVGYYVDRIARVKESGQTLYYRLSLEYQRPGGDEVEEFETPVLTPLARLNRREQRAVVDIMRNELTNMRGGNGVPAFLFAPLQQGLPAPGFDYETQQMHGSGMTTLGKESFGEAFVGGFGPPVLTWIAKFGAMVQSFVPAANGGSGHQILPISGRLLAFPRPMPGYMVVISQTDERFVIGPDNIVPFMFKGVLPVGYEVQLLPIPRTDARYKVPVPLISDELFARL